MMALDAVPNDVYVYRNVQSYQVLQRQLDTNSTWVQQQDHQYYEFKVGGPYTIDDAHHVMVGDIWILAGQSNMRGFGFFDGNKKKGCHVFQSNESWGLVGSDQPVHHISTSPRSVHHTLPDPTVREPSLVLDRGASLAPSFVEQYEVTLGVPVGVVPCAHGGVTIKQWMKNDTANNANTTLYGAMMDKIRLVGGRYTGVLWYQGESDAVHLDTATHYRSEFTRWLHQFQQKNPAHFVYAQIGRIVDTPLDHTLDYAWSLVRQAQLDIYLQHQHTLGIVSTIDTDLDDYIHLSSSALDNVGKRMADSAITLMKNASPCILYAKEVTMIHLPYNHTNKRWRRLLRLDVLDGQQMTWRNKEAITGFTIHDTQSKNGTSVDMIHSVRINAHNQVDLYLTEKGYQQLAQQQDGRYALWYGYGQNPQCNLVTTTNVAALAFGPLPIHVTTPVLLD